jgi:transglycosylase-like protein
MITTNRRTRIVRATMAATAVILVPAAAAAAHRASPARTGSLHPLTEPPAARPVLRDGVGLSRPGFNLPAFRLEPLGSGGHGFTGSGVADWYATARCESGDRWDINTGNGYWGGLQFAPQTWFAYGGGPFDGTGPFPYSASQQIVVAERVLAAQGWQAWPNCFVWAR